MLNIFLVLFMKIVMFSNSSSWNSSVYSIRLDIAGEGHGVTDL